MNLSSFPNYFIATHIDEEQKKLKQYEREVCLTKFPYSVVLEIAYPQLDFGDWLLWNLLGEKNGCCDQKDSDFSVCHQIKQHEHSGCWTTLWYVKTDYDFGFNEWFFRDKSDCEIFIYLLPLLENFTYFGIYEDETFLVFLNRVSDEIKALPRAEKIKYLMAIDWKKLLEEVYERS